jgi:hypothetical protein
MEGEYPGELPKFKTRMSWFGLAHVLTITQGLGYERAMPLPSRKRHTKSPTTLPKEFLNTVSELFKKQFKGKLTGATFLVYGDLHASEVVFCVSLSHPKTLQAASFHISGDLPDETTENPEKVTEKLKHMVDVAASWFAQSLESGKGMEGVLTELTDMDPGWQSLEWEGQTFHVKLNKDNYALEKAASDFLKKSGFTEEEEEDELEAEIEAMMNDDEEGRGPLQ